MTALKEVHAVADVEQGRILASVEIGALPERVFEALVRAEEQTLMGLHGAYWRGNLAAGKIIAFGPVADPGGSWGVGLLRVSEPAEASALTESDPVMLAGKGFRYEVFAMPRAVHI